MSARPEVIEEANRLSKISPGLRMHIQNQKAFIAQMYFHSCPCPYCDAPVSMFDAVDETYNLGDVPKNCVCPKCGEKLKKVVPIIAVFAPWHWMKGE
jgi:rubredoxin